MTDLLTPTNILAFAAAAATVACAKAAYETAKLARQQLEASFRPCLKVMKMAIPPHAKLIKDTPCIVLVAHVKNGGAGTAIIEESEFSTPIITDNPHGQPPLESTNHSPLMPGEIADSWKLYISLSSGARHSWAIRKKNARPDCASRALLSPGKMSHAQERAVLTRNRIAGVWPSSYAFFLRTLQPRSFAYSLHHLSVSRFR